MKKTMNLLLVLIYTFFLFGCNNNPDVGGKPDQGIVPTHDFSVNSYLQSNAVYLQKEEFEINGKSENGVLIKADIYDENESLIKTASDIADNNGDFNIKIVAPEASYKTYKIVVSDTIHEHTYENILFGEVWICAGEQLNETVVNEEKYNNEFIRIFNYDNNAYSWSTYNESNVVYNMTWKLADELQKVINVPVAIIDSTLAFANADAWISHESASNQLKIQNYLKSINRYTESNENILFKTNTLSSMYSTYLEQYKQINVRGVIWQQGVTDFNVSNNIDTYKLVSNYTYLTSNIFLEYMNLFNHKIDIYSIQNGFTDIHYANQLRSAQEQSTYLVNKVHIIPTYDCHVLENDEEITNVNYIFSVEKYIDRIVNDILSNTYQKKSEAAYSMFTNVVINNGKITLTFSNDIELQSVDEIYGLSVTTVDNIELKYTTEIVENIIIIELENSILIDDTNIIITYAENYDLYKCNLYNVNNKPVLPFRIVISD